MSAHILLAAILVAAGTVAVGAQTDVVMTDDDAEQWVAGCVQDRDVLLRIESCTRVIMDGQAAIELGTMGRADLAWAFNNRGLAYESIRRPDRALGDYNTALLFDPNFAVAFNNRGNVLASMGDLRGAVADHTRAIELESGYADAYFNRGRDFEELGDLEAAVRDYDRTLAIEPDYLVAIQSRASAQCRLRNVDAAMADHMALLEAEFFTAEQLQEFLKDRGHYAGAIDGIFGRGSQSALRAWIEAGCPPGQ